jgi:hypothetical protein
MTSAWVVEWVRDDGTIKPIDAGSDKQDAIYKKIERAKTSHPHVVLRVTEYVSVDK